ncbi:helix-turn-helix domain-containing protein [Streptomyces sp. NPDC051909]|uniref:helix-turn-helix domain-containing protein n=1 Tax=Streptomyces sp. NPDC051909 TaxID=3154944 RepID=UPI00344A6B56
MEDFAHHLRHLRAMAGDPSVRRLAQLTGFGKTTISDAFAGRRLPTWDVAAQLAGALAADHDDLRERWAKARGGTGTTAAAAVPDWLTSVRSDIPDLTGAQGFEKACAAATSDPKPTLDICWGVLRVGALQFSHRFYGDIPGNWSSNVVDTYRRAEEDGLLPAGCSAVAETVHHYYVSSNVNPGELPSTAELLQIVVLSYRLAWQARDLVTEREPQ